MEPELEKAKEDVKELAVDLDDELIYALYPLTGKRFLRWKYGKEDVPEEVKPKTLEQIKAEEELVKKAKAGLLVEKVEKEAPEKGEGYRKFNVFVDNEYFEVEVEHEGGTPVVSTVGRPVAAPVAKPSPVSAPVSVKEPETAKPAPQAKAAADVKGTPLTAPMPGMIIRYEKQEGDSVSQGDTVLILEAMKMENALTAPVDGVIKSINYASGDSVAKDDVLCVIG